jgi:hypothetical protein
LANLFPSRRSILTATTPARGADAAVKTKSGRKEQSRNKTSCGMHFVIKRPTLICNETRFGLVFTWAAW